MEFFLSKVWAFMVGMVLLGVLLQGVNMQAQTERSSALQEVAENIQELFVSTAGAGPGLERTLEMSEVLPSSLRLTLTEEYASLDDGDETYFFAIGLNALLLEMPSGELETVVSVSIDAHSTLMLITEEQGLTVIAINPRTSPPDT